MKLLPPPGRARNQQVGLLAVVLFAGAVLLWRSLGPDPALTVSATSNPQTRPAAGAEPAKTLPQAVALAKLEPVADAPATSRNPFRFGEKPRPPTPPPPPVVLPPYVAPTPPPPTGPPPPPPISGILKLVGIMTYPDKRALATVLDNRGNVIQGLEGQTIEGKYRIVKIATESIIIEYVSGLGRTTLGLK